LLRFNRQELGRFNMRQFANAFDGYLHESRERWEQARMISYYSAFDRKPFKIHEISIPCENKDMTESTQEDKDRYYKILEKWNK
jgi:hypothetical protein